MSRGGKVRPTTVSDHQGGETHMTKKAEAASSRRDFLKIAVTTAPLAAVAVATTGGEAEAAAPDLAKETMQDTAHTRAYYESVRF